jgi:hypothetical protein
MASVKGCQQQMAEKYWPAEGQKAEKGLQFLMKSGVNKFLLKDISKKEGTCLPFFVFLIL